MVSDRAKKGPRAGPHCRPLMAGRRVVKQVDVPSAPPHTHGGLPGCTAWSKKHRAWRASRCPPPAGTRQGDPESTSGFCMMRCPKLEELRGDRRRYKAECRAGWPGGWAITATHPARRIGDGQVRAVLAEGREAAGGLAGEHGVALVATAHVPLAGLGGRAFNDLLGRGGGLGGSTHTA